MQTKQRRLKILLTEGTTTSSRQVIYALAALRPVIDVCDPAPMISLARASTLVRSCYRCPPYTGDPAAFVRFLAQRLRNHRFDVLLPVHDEIFAVAAFRDTLAQHAGLAVPPFEALQQLQSKASFTRLLRSLNLPHPPTIIGRSRQQLRPLHDGPHFVKLAYGTAGRGVWYARDASELEQHLDRLEQQGAIDGQDVLVQLAVPGTLSVVQGIFQHGRLVAAHCYQSLAPGVGGSPRARISVDHPDVIEQVNSLGRHLDWHGALFIDYLYDAQIKQAAYIDANPRIGETMNALHSGVNLPAKLVQVARGEQVVGCDIGRSGVRTHSALTTMLDAAIRGANRRQLLMELARAAFRRGVYTHSSDELTRTSRDPLALLPLLGLCLRLLCNPRSGDDIVGRSVARYALTDTAAKTIEALFLQRKQAQIG